MAYTTTQLLSAIERRSFAPENQATFDNEEILAIADEVLQSYILPAILQVREEFFVTYLDRALVPAQASYALPPRAIGLMARDIILVSSAGNIKRLERTEPERIGNFSTSGSPDRFYLRGNNVFLDPIPSSSDGDLRMFYFLQPGSLVETTSSAVVSSIDPVTKIVTVTTIPSSWVTGNIFDFTKKDGGHEYRDIGYTSTLVAGTNITFSELPADLAVGDYMTLEGTSALIQLPPEFRPVLAVLTAAEMLDSMNQPGSEKLVAKGQKMLETAIKVLTPRVQGAPQVVVPDWS